MSTPTTRELAARTHQNSEAIPTDIGADSGKKPKQNHQWVAKRTKPRAIQSLWIEGPSFVPTATGERWAGPQLLNSRRFWQMSKVMRLKPKL